jgi:hypothetical protein
VDGPINRSAAAAIEASKIAGHSDLEMTGEYTFVTPERQNELTHRIQERLAGASKTMEQNAVQTSSAVPSPSEQSPNLWVQAWIVSPTPGSSIRSRL